MAKKILIIAFILIPFIASAYQGSNVTLLQGTVKDEAGNPVGAEFKFINTIAKPVSLKSNSKDGSYQQPLVQGERYLPIFKGYVLANGFEYIEIAKEGKYAENRRDFVVKPIETNLRMMSYKLFKNGDTVLSQDATEYLKILKAFYNVNKNLIFRATISVPDVAFKQTTRKIKVKVKNKSTTKTVKVSAKDIEAEFIQARINQLTNALKEIEMPITVIHFEKKIKANPSKIISNSNDFEIYIHQIKNL